MSLYSEFIGELQGQFKDFGYGWSKSKENSCNWMLHWLQGGAGVDVGGTAYLVKQAAAKGCDITYFDYFPPSDPAIEKFVAADMSAFAEHFAARSLDFITTRHTLEHSLNPLFQLWQYNRCLKDDGLLVVVVPQHTKGWVWFYSHFNCLPQENWLMLFHRAGFAVEEANAGSWWSKNPDYIEYRFVLRVESRTLRLDNPFGDSTPD
ncbi:methyltransferase domain-containing protein [Stutzerimonas sp. VN223-3]|uniref:class I SAM-dependent methyltransferase n=1 Tax=Stutzerimonas sp. VN223-3 TaxID=3384601 RepID=UPI0038B67779